MNLKERNFNMRKFFNEKIDGYDNVHNSYMSTKTRITDSLREDALRILDLGVGTGLELIPLFEKFPNMEVVAIDITENMLKELKKRPFADKVTIVCGDFFEVDFGNGFDAVISTSALHHFLKEDKYVLYKKIYDSLKQGGQFINADRIVDTLEEEKKFLDDYYCNKDKRPHLDTPLAVSTEKEILEVVGFCDITFEDDEKDTYKLMKTIKK